MSKLERIINQIRSLNIQSALSPELIEFRKLYSNVYNDEYIIDRKQNNRRVGIEYNINGYSNIKYSQLKKIFNISESPSRKIEKNNNKSEKIEFTENKRISKTKIINLDNYDYKYYNKKERDVYSWMFFNIFCDEIHKMNITERQELLKNIKYEVLVDFNKHDMYKLYSYNEDFKKSELDYIFGMKQDVPLSMVRIYGDVFNINVITINKDGNIKYMNICKSRRATWLIVEGENGEGWYNIIKRKDSENKYLRYEEIDEIKIKKVEEKMGLDELQNYAKGLGIDPKKEGKVGKKNKLKSELVEEINNNLI
jgi:hypothetical protein